jgi:hypothetical protein
LGYRTSGLRAAVLLDGGFVTKKLSVLLGRFPLGSDVVELATRLMGHTRLAGVEVFRIFYYDAPPMNGTKENPVDGSLFDFGAHPTYNRNQALQESLAVTADFAVRRGETVFHGWRLRPRALRELTKSPRALSAADLVPDVTQKGVDLRIGRDVVRSSRGE